VNARQRKLACRIAVSVFSLCNAALAQSALPEPTWGVISMPLAVDRGGPLSPDDAHRLVEWVLSQ